MTGILSGMPLRQTDTTHDSSVTTHTLAQGRTTHTSAHAVQCGSVVWSCVVLGTLCYATPRTKEFTVKDTLLGFMATCCVSESQLTGA